MEKIFIKKKAVFGKKLPTTLIIAILLFLSFAFSGKVKNSFYKLSLPVQSFFWIAGESVSNFTESFSRKTVLKEENVRLKEERRELIARISHLRSIYDENEILREALNMGIADDFESVIADVLGKDLGEDNILINKGKSHGLSVGMPVVTQKRIIVGRIIEVYDDFSRVMMITHKNSVFDAEVQGREVIGALKGGASGAFLDLVPKEEEIQPGDAVITTNLGGVFPANLFVGLVRSAKSRSADPFKSIEIQPFFETNRLKQVFVITGK